MPNQTNATDRPIVPTNAGQVAGYIGAAADPPAVALLPAPRDGDLMDLQGSGAPTDGVAEIQTLTIGGTPTAGSFKLRVRGHVTASIPWNATNATLLAAIDAALEALPAIGVAGVVTAAGTLTAGIGTVLLTYAAGGSLGGPVEVDTNALTGTSPTLAIATSTPGVLGTGGGQAGIGSRYTNIAPGAGQLYLNGGTKARPVWKLVTRAA